jgi:hypothetical protein
MMNKHTPRINAPLIVFGRDPVVTYPLLVAIAQRRLKQQKRQLRMYKIKKALSSAITNIFRKTPHPQPPLCP